MLNTNQFFYDKENKVLSQEASSLNWMGAPHMFTMESEHTGRKVAMELKETYRDREGEIMHWTYKCNIVPHLTVIVFND